MIRIFSAPILAQAHIIRGALEAAGLMAEVRGEARTALAGGLPLDQCFAEVWVADADAPSALELLKELAPGRGAGDLSLVPEGASGGELSVPGDWRCAACGEPSPSTFDSCWACGLERAP